MQVLLMKTLVELKKPECVVDNTTARAVGENSISPLALAVVSEPYVKRSMKDFVFKTVKNHTRADNTSGGCFSCHVYSISTTFSNLIIYVH